MPFGSGRAAFFGEAAMFSAQLSDKQPMGMNAPMAEQNFQFVLNVMHWLSGIRETREKAVRFLTRNAKTGFLDAHRAYDTVQTHPG